jgi:hypothetical protein
MFRRGVLARVFGLFRFARFVDFALGFFLDVDLAFVGDLVQARAFPSRLDILVGLFDGQRALVLDRCAALRGLASALPLGVDFFFDQSS